MPYINILAITRTTDDRARKSAEADGILKYSSHFSDILSDHEIDIVVIATPPYLHAEQAVAALEAGKHVLVEKPPATTVEDGRRILDAALRTGRQAAVNFIMRYNPINELVKEAAGKNLLGSLYRVLQENYASSQGLDPGHWFWDISKSGGIFIEHGVHFFDLTNWITGSEPQTIQGLLTSRASGIEDKALANVRYSDNTLATFYNSFSRPAIVEKTSVVYVFDRGEIVTEGWIPLDLRLHGFVSESELYQLKKMFDGAYVSADPLSETRLESGGRTYQVAVEVDLHYELKEDKEEVYAQAAADLLADFIRSIEDPGYRMRVTFKESLEALRMACEASEFRS